MARWLPLRYTTSTRLYSLAGQEHYVLYPQEPLCSPLCRFLVGLLGFWSPDRWIIIGRPSRPSEPSPDPWNCSGTLDHAQGPLNADQKAPRPPKAVGSLSDDPKRPRCL
ncbi:hypothetical protein PGT21_034248 [Puccinia graminis f. sp. tritici]|uniref:Uncharacterized protein n=1 Tax=Puccinia graminis f. sp. tritici TaxID=56615 RepID=A0A5B0MQJ2_PUCGR|nr:hypothetical protein PGT21_034248 [Puccinia graminis f. sp. tritici]